ncbi:lysyl oxidase family protein [Jiangella asiatica]|uniref:Uncharacterized protein n=1 Tax=Jiangella asiatica TaxID=2530372 RepID=A0A4R5CN04_9ACTN|nr:lysyl oxidase family protein [Jiangella asiatica]TDD98944.1 hypothetical protein E1269_28095 [Jiangella asiatica]
MAVVAAFPVLLTGCQDDAPDGPAESPVPQPSGSPVGEPVLPDFAPAPPVDVHTKDNGDGWQIEFSSVLVNVGEGEFRLIVDRPTVDDDWMVTQVITHSGGGIEEVPTDAEVEWGGDGHDHWHVRRVVTYRLVAIDDSGTPALDGGLTDAKVGFCIYDFGRELDDLGPDDAVFNRDGCQPEDALTLTMGLSPGWGDTYEWNLPGQSIDVTDLPDGPYRLWAEADESGHFVETSTDNNDTWVDLDLSTTGDGTRTAVVADIGPTPDESPPPG